ncbi:MAG: hypothetical protein VYD19_08470, partial [Myxococcota bacterium]|nr:hypothetical protein [Myxococcota bacterium]
MHQHLWSVEASRLWALFITLFCVACHFPEVVLSDADRREIKAHILSEAPSPQIKLNAILEDQVELIGLDLSKKTVRAGERLKITWYLKVLADRPQDTKPFIHLQGRGGQRGWMNLDHHPIRGL